MVVKCIINGVRVHGPPYTKAEEDDFYRRNAGGPVAMTSLTRGRGFSGVVGDHDCHVGAYQSALRSERLWGHWAGPLWQQAEQAMFYDDSGD
jgi:hypothetical protein